ncbi:aerolysin family beta-barrel pore-forming toxin [Pedobacter sp. NJ-S-72]
MSRDAAAKNEENLTTKSDPENPIAAGMKSTTLKELGYNSVDEMIKEGWQIVEEFKPAHLLKSNTGSELISSAGSAVKNTQADNNIPLTLDHLRQLGFNPDNEAGRIILRDLFRRSGVRPDGIVLSRSQYIEGGVVTSDVANGNVQAFVTTGSPIVTVDAKGIEYPDEVYTTEAINNADTSAKKITVDYTYQSGYKTSWSRQVTGSFKLGAKGKIGIPFVAEGEVSTEIMIGGATTDGTESSNTKTIKSAYTADVPANSKVIITVLTRKKQSKVSYKVPMELTGQISVNYPSSVDGHYFWYDNANILLKNPKAEEGVAQAVENITTQIIASKPVKI